MHRFVVLPLLAMVAAAQNQDLPTIRVVTRLVDLSVIARNNKGPVADLCADDFTVFDNGIQRKVAFFSVNSSRPPAAPFGSRPRNLFTNQPAARADAAIRLSVVVLDGLNTAFEFQSRARDQVLKFVREIGPRDRVAIYAFDTSLRRLQGFTGDTGQLLSAVEHYTPSIRLAPSGPSGPPRMPPADDAQQYVAAAGAAVASADQYYRMHLTTDLMKDLAQELARIPGRKNLIWLSASFPMEIRMAGDHPDNPTSFREEFSGAAKALARASGALYPVDVMGLVAPAGGQNAMAVSITEKSRHDIMDELAAVTGGRAFYDNNDLAGEMRAALADAEVTYTIGFYPDSAAQDGSYHHVEIELDREGVELRYRQGYFANDPQITVAESDGADQIRDALASPIDSTGLTLNTKIEDRDPKRPGSLRMTIGIPAKDLNLQPPENGIVAAFDVIVAQRGADGRNLVTYGDVTRIDPRQQRYETLLRDGVLIRKEIQLAAGVSRIRVVVFDRGSGRLGSLEFAAPK